MEYEQLVADLEMAQEEKDEARVEKLIEKIAHNTEETQYAGE
jgi:hypothetical protein